MACSEERAAGRIPKGDRRHYSLAVELGDVVDLVQVCRDGPETAQILARVPG